MIKLKKSFFLLKKRKIYERLDFYPLLFINLLLLFILYLVKEVYIFSYIIILLFIYLLQGIIYITNYFNSELGIQIIYFCINKIKIATHVKVLILSSNENIINRTMICKIICDNNIIKIEIDRMIYIYDHNINQFIRSKYELIKKEQLSYFCNINPISESELPEKKARFGPNTIDIPSPSFFSLYKEHIITPFFIFHLFCSIIRIFDNNSYKYIISLIMTLIFEITITWKRIFNSATLKNLKTPSHYVYVYRNDVWSLISSIDIYPGDIVSLSDGFNLKNIKENKENKTNLIIRILNLLNNIKIRQEAIKNQKSINTVLNKYKEKEVLPITCDLLLLSGKAIVSESLLTGKSYPKIKQSILNSDNININSKLDIKKEHKNFIILSGSKIVQIEQSDFLPKNINKAPPNNGIICLVLKTGFSSYQGKSLHKMLFNKGENYIKNKKYQMIFIIFLFSIALLSSIHILIETAKRGELSYHIIFRIIIILTSIVPADFPIELSLLIYKCISYFESKSIVCSEPSKVPLAGNIDICCFDMTGTLTNDDFNILGIINTNNNDNIISLLECDDIIHSILLGCNSLNNMDGKTFGEPIDLAIFKEIKGNFNNNEITSANGKIKVVRIKNFTFESELRRSTVIAKIYNDKETEKYNIKVLCKGAPEVIKKLLKNDEEQYEQCYEKWSKNGYKLIALAYKDIEECDLNNDRENLEKNLIFAGFCIFENPLKEKVDKYIKELIKSKYEICILSGESVLTTLKVANELKIGPDKFLYLNIQNSKLIWKNIDNQIITETTTLNEIKELSKEYILGITNDEYNNLNNLNYIENIYSIVLYIKLFCRMSQSQKIKIIENLQKYGKNPLMVGDGTNDIGALKSSKIGVTLLNIKETIIGKKDFLYFDEDTVIKNWDTTAISQFISKGESIKCIKNILLMGKCAFVTSKQMYKIFIINSFSTIYCESFLALKGIKFSEYQYANLAFIVSMFYLMFSKAKPLNKLNSNKPNFEFLDWKNLTSIFGQIFINITSMNLLLYFSEKVDPFLIGQEVSLDEKFSPNLNNSIIYMYQVLNQVIIFTANYQGEPFMENIYKNSSMIKLIIGILSIGCVYIFDLYPQINDDFEMVALPEDNQYKLTIVFILVFNFCFCYFLEKWKNIFGLYEPYEKSKNKKKKN